MQTKRGCRASGWRLGTRASGVGGGANRRRSRRQLTAASRVQGLGPSRSLGREGWQWRAAQHVVARRDPRDGLAGADGERGDATEAARGDVAVGTPTDDVRARGSGCGRARWRRGWRQRWRRGRGWGRGWRRGWRGRGRHGRARDSPRARAAAIQLVVAVAHGAPRSTEEIAAAVGVGAHGACRFWGRRRRRRRGRRRRRRGRLRPGWRAGRQRRRAGRWGGTVGCDLRPENVFLAELDPAVGAGGAGGVRVADGAAQVLRPEQVEHGRHLGDEHDWGQAARGGQGHLVGRAARASTGDTLERKVSCGSEVPTTRTSLQVAYCCMSTVWMAYLGHARGRIMDASNVAPARLRLRDAPFPPNHAVVARGQPVGQCHGGRVDAARRDRRVQHPRVARAAHKVLELDPAEWSVQQVCVVRDVQGAVAGMICLQVPLDGERRPSGDCVGRRRRRPHVVARKSVVGVLHARCDLGRKEGKWVVGLLEVVRLGPAKGAGVEARRITDDTIDPERLPSRRLGPGGGGGREAAASGGAFARERARRTCSHALRLWSR